MKSSYVFTENQQFRQRWIWYPLMIICIMTITMMIIGIKTHPVTHNTWIGFLFGLIGPFFVLLLLYKANLKTIIDSSGISYRFFPFQFKIHRHNWEDIEEVYIRKYKPILEFGGWGVRHSLINGKAINVSGNIGLQIILKMEEKFFLEHKSHQK